MIWQNKWKDQKCHKLLSLVDCVESGDTRPFLSMCWLVWKNKWRDQTSHRWPYLAKKVKIPGYKLLRLADCVEYGDTRTSLSICRSVWQNKWRDQASIYFKHCRTCEKKKVAIGCSVLQTVWNLATQKHLFTCGAQSVITTRETRIHICCLIWQNK